MNANVFFPSQLNWTAQELAEAVPLRLHELFAFDAGPDDRASNAGAHLHGSPQRRGYLPAPQSSSFFRVR